MSLTVRPLERGIIRVFALSMDETAARALRNDPGAQARMLGLERLTEGGCEVFPVADLEELGLTGYLRDGNAVSPEQLEPDRAKLAAVDGWVLILYSRALPEEGATLTPAPELTLIGAYAEPGVDWTPGAPLASKAATDPGPPAKPHPSDAAMSGRIASLALLVIFALTALLIWVAA